MSAQIGLNTLFKMGVNQQFIQELSHLSEQPIVFEKLQTKLYQAFQHTLLQNVKINSEFMVEEKQKLQNAINMADIMHCSSITKVHQHPSDCLTLVRFVQQDYIVSASDDGLVKLYQIVGGFLKLKSVLVQKSMQSSIQCLESYEYMIAAQFDNNLVVWDLKNYIFDDRATIIPPIFEQKQFYLKYKSKSTKEEVSEELDNLFFVDANTLIIQSKQRIVYINLKQKQSSVIFQFANEADKQDGIIGWSDLDRISKRLYFIFAKDEYQFISFLECDGISQTPWSVWATEEKHHIKQFCGEVGDLKYIQVNFNLDVNINRAQSVIPEFIQFHQNLILFSFENCSHFFAYKLEKIEEKFLLLKNNIQSNQTPKQNKRIEENKSFMVIQEMPISFNVQNFSVPANLLDNPIISADNIQVSDGNVLLCDVQIKSGTKYKKWLLFFDLNQLKENKLTYTPVRAVSLSGFSGSGIQFRSVNFKTAITVQGYNSVKEVKSAWVVTDAISSASMLSQTLTFQDKYNNQQDIVFQNSDNILYFLSEMGDDLLGAIRLPGPNTDTSFQYSDIKTKTGFVAVTNSFGNICLINDIKLQNKEMIQPSSQFFVLEMPGLCKYKFAEQKAKHIKQLNQLCKVILNKQKLIDKDNFKEFLKKIFDAKLDYSIVYKNGKKYYNSVSGIEFDKVLVIDIQANTILIPILFEIYSIKQQIMPSVVMLQQNIYKILLKPNLDQSCAFMEIIQQLLNNVPHNQIVNEKQLICSSQSQVQQRLVDSLNSVLPISFQSALNTLSLPLQPLMDAGYLALLKNIYQINKPSSEMYVGIHVAYQETDEIKFVNRNISANTSKYISRNLISEQFKIKKIIQSTKKKEDSQLYDSAIEAPIQYEYEEIYEEIYEDSIVQSNSNEYEYEYQYEYEDVAEEEQSQHESTKVLQNIPVSTPKLVSVEKPANLRSVLDINTQYRQCNTSLTPAIHNLFKVVHLLKTGQIVYFCQSLYNQQIQKINDTFGFKFKRSKATNGWYLVKQIFPVDIKNYFTLEIKLEQMSKENQFISEQYLFSRYFKKQNTESSFELQVLPLQYSLQGFHYLSGLTPLQLIIQAITQEIEETYYLTTNYLTESHHKTRADFDYFVFIKTIIQRKYQQEQPQYYKPNVKFETLEIPQDLNNWMYGYCISDFVQDDPKISDSLLHEERQWTTRPIPPAKFETAIRKELRTQILEFQRLHEAKKLTTDHFDRLVQLQVDSYYLTELTTAKQQIYKKEDESFSFKIKLNGCQFESIKQFSSLYFRLFLARVLCKQTSKDKLTAKQLNFFELECAQPMCINTVLKRTITGYYSNFREFMNDLFIIQENINRTNRAKSNLIVDAMNELFMNISIEWADVCDLEIAEVLKILE
ncbi:Conserved_hypothetical protein [Hexamita inflata]|uniref:Uncharacterized protein n=1 Tax=Hexamita inflata TaxID=28002 RepID=A0AA86NWI6_9EUKA|nr:Conserved hypothetical protein [Hexamita inflata]